MSESFDFDDPGRFTAGAIGEPGHRVFYFQVFAAGTEVSVKCEKQHAQALAEHLEGLLADLPDADAEGEPAQAAAPTPAEALPPTDLAWVVGSISLGVDRNAGRAVVVLEELVELDEEGDPVGEEPAQLRVRLTGDQIRAFRAQVDHLVAGSRPLCPLCERPIDPSGHACPRLN